MDEPRWGSTRVASHGVCVDGQRVVLVRDAGSGRWGLPGGKIEWGESPEAAVVREYGEETGLVVAVEQLLGVYSNVYERAPRSPHEPMHFIGIIYAVEVTGGALTDEVEGTTDQARWFALKDLEGVELNDHARHALQLADSVRGRSLSGPPRNYTRVI